MKIKTVYKLFRERRDGTLGSLFINKKDIIPIGLWMPCQFFPTKGFKPREGWHTTEKPYAPHLSMKGRVWRKVRICDYTVLERPLAQGGRWYLAKHMKVLPLKLFEVPEMKYSRVPKESSIF